MRRLRPQPRARSQVRYLRPRWKVYRCNTARWCSCHNRPCSIQSHRRLLVPGMPAVPGGPNRPNRGAIPPVPPGPLHAPNLTPPTIEGLSVQNFQQALQTFFELIAHPQVTAQLPVELRNLDQLKVLLDTLPDYHSEDEQPSYVLAIPCRPIVIGLSVVLPLMPCLSTVNWSRLGAPG